MFAFLTLNPVLAAFCNRPNPNTGYQESVEARKARSRSNQYRQQGSSTVTGMIS